MKFKLSTTKFGDLINRAERITSRKSALPILSKILVIITKESFAVRTTNLEVGLEGEVSIVWESEPKEGKFAVEAQVLKNFLSQVRSSKDMTLEVKESVVELSTTTTTATITISEPDDFPSLPQFEKGEVTSNIQIQASDFIDSVSSVSYASAVSTMKPELSSIYIHSHNNELYFVATDTFRLAEKVLPIKTQGDISLLIPQQNAVELTKVIDLEAMLDLEFTSNLLKIKQNKLLITVRVVDGTFPDYRQIIPAEFDTEATVLFYDYENSLRLSSIFADKYHQVTLEFGEKEVVINSKGNEQGQSSITIPAGVTGETMSSRFNQRYLSEPLSSLKGDNLLVKLSPNKPMLISNPSDQTFRYLVMPMHQ